MKYLIQSYRFQIIFTLAGAFSGFLYWYYIGCNSGSCAIKSVWYWSTLWGAAVGYLAGDFLNDFIVKRRKKTEEKRK